MCGCGSLIVFFVVILGGELGCVWLCSERGL